MQIHHLSSTGTALDFNAAIKRASAVAYELLGDNMLLSWYDRERDQESPAHASIGGVGLALKVDSYCPVLGQYENINADY